MRTTYLPATLIIFLLATTPALTQTKSVNPPALSSIKAEDLKKDLFEMAGDHFKGREGGTSEELKVSVWLADRMRDAGLKPAGDDGTYFQFFPVWRSRLSAGSTVSIGNKSMTLWKDVLITQTAPFQLNVPVVYVGDGSAAQLSKLDIKGKAVAIKVSAEGINLNVSLPERRYPSYILGKYNGLLASGGAAAIIFIADAMGEKSWSQVVPGWSRGTYAIQPSSTVPRNRTPVLWVHSNAEESLNAENVMLSMNVFVEKFEYPSVNIVGKIDGTDPVLKKEYVLYSSHQDHDGERQPYGQDSIFNGADDNATVSVALLAIARAFHKSPGKRSALFVWHGAEERGLLGSRWYSASPTVPKESIAAVLNGDMIGRNHPDSAALLGVSPAHKNSSDLVAMALEANLQGPNFKLDTLWDKPTHNEGWYFRSDHLPYARAGIPAIFYSTLLHPDYHTPMDEPARIDLVKLKKMTEWMYRTGWKVANADKRPAVLPGFRLER